VLNSLGIAVLVVLAVLGLLVTLWVFLPVFQGPEAASRAIGSTRLTLGAWLAVFVVNGAITAALEPFLHFEQPFTSGTFLVAALSTDIPLFLVLYLRLIVPRALTWADLGLRPLPIGYVLSVGVGGGVMGLIVSVGVESVLARLGLEPNQLEQYAFVLKEGRAAFAIVLVLGAVVAPFAEELFFRGFVFGLYRRRHPRWLAYLVSGVLFTIPHLLAGRMNLSQIAGLAIGIFILALILAWLYERTGSLLPGMVAHSVNNATSLIAFYASNTLARGG
jgi:uncharacterized protein